MKKIVATFAACVCLGLSTVSAYAETPEIPKNSQTSGEINVDFMLKEYNESLAKNEVNLARFIPGPWKDADRGQFRAYADGDKHGSQFMNNYKYHGCSATNSNATKYSRYEAPGDTAQASILITPRGNKVNWTTDNWGRG